MITLNILDDHKMVVESLRKMIDDSGVTVLTHNRVSFNRGIILLTTYKELNIVRRALHNGAYGYILKNAGIVMSSLPLLDDRLMHKYTS